jgi:hypothetical protein
MRQQLFSMAGAALTLLTLQDAHAQRVPLLGDIQATAWTVEANTFAPRGDFHEQFRDIRALSFELARSWRFTSGLEARMGGGWFRAQGETSEPLSSELPRQSNADGLSIAFGARYVLPEWGRVRVFAEGVLGFVWTPGDPFPTGGTAVNGMTRWGAGATWRVSGDWSIDTGYRRMHLSNGGGIVDHNPAWEAHNVYVGLRRGFDKQR